MLRVLAGQPGTLSVPWESKPTSGTVTITRDRDSSVIVSAQSVTVESDRFYYQLAAQSVGNHTAVFTITDANGSNTVTVPVQVVGNRVCSISDVRTLKPLDNVNRYSNELIDRAITEVEDALETACGVSFIPVERVNVLHDGTGTQELFTRHARPISLSSVSVTDSLGAYVQQLTNTDISGLVLDQEAGVIIRPTFTWFPGRRNVAITGIFGFRDVPGMVRQAVMKQVRYMLVDTPAQDRAMSVTSEDGTTQNMIVAGVAGRRFATPEMNAIVDQFRQTFGVA